MRTILFLMVGMAVCCAPCGGQTADKYGGLTNVKCQTATGWFHTERIDKRWWLCTPEGHGFFFQGVGAWQVVNPSNKYGSTNEAAKQLMNEVRDWYFNGVGELSNQMVEPIGHCQGCPKLPEVQTLNVSNYAAANLWNYATRPMKNLRWGLNGHYTGWRASLMDFFEPQFGVWLDGYFVKDKGVRDYLTSPYTVALFLDDTDWFWGMGSGPDFHTIPEGRTNSHVGYMTLITSPVQTFNPDPASRGIPMVYTDTKVYSKAAMANLPAACSIQTPCSLRDYLYKKYNGNIAALNAAWGSNYTTFDSSGTSVKGEMIGTGDGSKTVFTAKLARSPISPESLHLLVAGVIQGGDCPWFNGCNVSALNSGSIMGTGETLLVSGGQPWLSDFSARDCGRCGLPPASYWVRIAYHMKPGFHSSPSREVGNTYQSPNQQIVVPSPEAIPNATGWDVYVSCANLSRPTMAWCGPVGQYAEGKEILQSSNIPFGQSWVEPSIGLTTNGAQVPGPPSFIDYSNGNVTVTFSTPVPRGGRVTADYVSNGWMTGSGLMDEDGRHSAWVGTNPICLSPATVCDGQDYPRPTANPRLAADLDAWIAQFASQYFGTLNKHLKAAAPQVLYFGADTVGTWGAPPRKEILQGAAPYVDALFTVWFGDQPDAITGAQHYQYLSRYFGDKPLMNFMALHAQRDSAMSEFPNGQCCFGLSTQAARGQQWNTIITKMLNAPSYNGTYQWVGIVWWGLYDFGNERINWGLKTPSDNAYDGREAVTAKVACSPPLEKFTCGGEKKTYGDLITSLKNANQAWIRLATKLKSSGSAAPPK
jgi:hypothetical protein